MRLTHLLTAIAATGLVAAPVAAAANANPASALSLSKARVGAPAAKGQNALGGRFILGAVLLVGFIVVVVIAAKSDEDRDDLSDSN